MEGFDSVALFVVITAAITLWQMFSDNTSTKAAHYHYKPQDFYGE